MIIWGTKQECVTKHFKAFKDYIGPIQVSFELWNISLAMTALPQETVKCFDVRGEYTMFIFKKVNYLVE